MRLRGYGSRSSAFAARAVEMLLRCSSRAVEMLLRCSSRAVEMLMTQRTLQIGGRQGRGHGRGMPRHGASGCGWRGRGGQWRGGVGAILASPRRHHHVPSRVEHVTTRRTWRAPALVGVAAAWIDASRSAAVGCMYVHAVVHDRVLRICPACRLCCGVVAAGARPQAGWVGRGRRVDDCLCCCTMSGSGLLSPVRLLRVIVLAVMYVVRVPRNAHAHGAHRRS